MTDTLVSTPPPCPACGDRYCLAWDDRRETLRIASGNIWVLPKRARIAHGGQQVGCRNPDCKCHDVTQWIVCEQWMGYGEDWCPRCGWNRAAHPTIGAQP